MRFGVCTGADNLDLLAEAGYDYIELGVTSALQPEKPDGEVMPRLLAAFDASRLEAQAYNVLLPADLKVVGPETDMARQDRYLDTAFRRASALGGQVVVFGSGGARGIPPDWPREKAERQIVDFLKRCGPIAECHGMQIAIEPLNVTECNIINSVAEGVRLAQAADHPAVRVLSDLYHVDHDGQSFDETRDAAPLLCHVHVAGAGRRAPTSDDHQFLRGFFAVLKASGYDGRISIEGSWDNLANQAAESLAVLRRAWNAV